MNAVKRICGYLYRTRNVELTTVKCLWTFLVQTPKRRNWMKIYLSIEVTTLLARYGSLCFLDIKAAYDSVDRNILLSKLRKKKVCRGMPNAIFSLFELNQSVVIFKNKKRSLFRNDVGLLQGSIPSPIL